MATASDYTIAIVDDPYNDLKVGQKLASRGSARGSAHILFKGFEGMTMVDAEQLAIVVSRHLDVGEVLVYNVDTDIILALYRNGEFV